MSTLHSASRLGFRPAGAIVLVLASLPRPVSGQWGLRQTEFEHRTRFERLDMDFRAAPSDGLSVFALRTLVGMEMGTNGFRLGLEWADSRVYTEDLAPLNTTQVNTLEPLSGYLAVSASGVLAPDDAVALRLGRLTMNRGSRRLVARNVFRNTINSFTGLDVSWTTPSRIVQAFVVVPVTRLPTAAAALADNEREPDEENTDALFWSLHHQSHGGGAGSDASRRVQLEVYVVGLHEGDGSAATSNRRLLTPGMRLLRSPAAGSWDFQLEAMLQLGTSRASAAAADTEDLSHRALSGHASLGRRFAAPWTPRVVLQYDYASGDGDPADDSNDRFDPLFGARAFELNATGFYGAFARSNISSPGVRVEAAPHTRFDVMGAYRLFWLASARDAWTTAGLRDATGDSGGFVGHQVEARLRARIVPDVAVLELGGAVLRRGYFARVAPGGRSESAAYFYTQVTVGGAS